MGKGGKRQNPSGRTPGFILSRVVMLPERRCISPNEYKVTANIRRYLRHGNAEMIFVYNFGRFKSDLRAI